ncbi:MAG: hypothetical protein WBC67_17845 [Candidatus Acidiferrales bacterium]
MALSDLLTLIFAGATVWLAIATQRMARATRELLALSAEPYFSFAGIDILMITGDPKGYAARLRLRNPGQIRITYEVQDIIMSVSDIDYPPTAFVNSGGVIHPGEEIQFTYPQFACAVPPISGVSGALRFDGSFWASPAQRKRLTLTVQWLLVEEENELKTRFTYLSGPTYT